TVRIQKKGENYDVSPDKVPEAEDGGLNDFLFTKVPLTRQITLMTGYACLYLLYMGFMRLIASSVKTRSDQEQAGRMAETAYLMEVYEEHKIIGSPHKDVLGEERAKVIGAEINTSDRAARKGVATVGAPICKRLAMSWLTLQLRQLNQTTDVLRLCVVGAWTSIAMYRRPLMSIFTAAHRLVDAALVESEHPRIARLPRSVADELTVMSVLALLAVADVGALFEGRVFATDASEEKGAITSANVPITVVEKLWRSCKTKGAYSRLKTQHEILLDRLGIRDEAAVDDTTQYDTLSSFQPGPSKQLAFQYDFIEVYAGSARVSQAAARLGMRVGPPVDISYSGELDMTLTRVVAWLSYMLVSGNLGSIMVEPIALCFFEAVKSRQRSILEYDDYKTDGLSVDFMDFMDLKSFLRPAAFMNLYVAERHGNFNVPRIRSLLDGVEGGSMRK
ncbi:Uncharacterized protein SCF082_LOCUS11952, partial [Durusdinium trenchii]